MKILPDNGEVQFDKDQTENYIQHIKNLYDARKTECFRKILISETIPCTFSLNRITCLPWKWNPEKDETAEPYWQMTSFTKDDFNHPLKREYYFSDVGQLRYYREIRENVVGNTIIELDESESFVSWEVSGESPEEGIGWVLYTDVYDENGHIIDHEWIY